MLKIHGLKNCDTCRAALKWARAQGDEAEFVDFRKDGLAAEDLKKWVAVAGWETLLNRRGTTWRNLPDGVRNDIDGAGAETLMLEHVALIKRPVFTIGDHVVVGFKGPEKATLKRLLAG